MCFSDAPKGVNIRPQSGLELKAGDKLILTCSVERSNPAAEDQSYRWYKDATKIEGQTINTLTVSNVTGNDMGWYKCQARNTVGETMSTNSARVSVKCKYYVGICGTRYNSTREKKM